MIARLLLVCIPLLLSTVVASNPSAAAGRGRCPPTSDLNLSVVDCERSGAEANAIYATRGTSGYDYIFRMRCRDNVLQPLCDNPRDCVTPDGKIGFWYVLMRLDILDPPADAVWEYYGDVCFRPGEREEIPLITPGRVWERMKLLDWPTADLVVQPTGGRTLVNFRTNAYSNLLDVPVTEEISMFQIPVVIEADPISYTWHWGDGSSETTSGPGGPVPDDVTDALLDELITHEYTDADVTVTPSVDITYGGRYQVDGGDWVAIEQTLTLPGPTVALEVIEARVHLVG